MTATTDPRPPAIASEDSVAAAVTPALAGRQRVAQVLWAAVVLAIGSLSLAAGYGSAWAGALTALTVLLAVGLVTAGLALRVNRWAVAIAAVVLGVVALVTVMPEDTGHYFPGVADQFGPLLDAVPRLLTAPRPAPASPDMLAPALLLVWLTSVVVALLVVPGRSAGVAPLVGGAVLYVAGALLTAGQGDGSGTLAFVLIGVLAIGWVVLPRPGAQARRARSGEAAASPAPSSADRPRRRGSPALAAVPLLAVSVAAVVALVAAILPGTGAFEPRRYVPPPQLPAMVDNPLPHVQAWNIDGERELFSVRPGGAPLPERMMLAVLADFSGATWGLDGRFRQVGVVDSADLPPGVRRAPVDAEVEILGLVGPWVPTAGIAREVLSGTDPGGTSTAMGSVLMDVDTGTLLVPGGPEQGVTRIIGERDAPTEAELAQAGVPPASEAQRYLALPRLPGELAEEARAITAEAASRYEQARAIEAALREGLQHDPLAPSGSSYGRIQEFLFLGPGEGGQIGSAEQFAASFAVLARAVGLPTRLVVGADLAAADVADGAVVVRGEHITVWPEVYFARVGWVAFDPTSEEAAVAPPQQQPEDEPDGETEEPTSEPTEQPTEQVGSGEEPRTQTSSSLPVVAGVAGALLLVVLLTLATLRGMRRLRWRGGGAAGALAHMVDALVLAGRRPGVGDTAEAIAESVPEPVREGSRRVARSADAAAFAPAAAGGLPGAEDSADDAPGAWRSAVAVETELRRQLPWWRRWWWRLDPRVLGR